MNRRGGIVAERQNDHVRVTVEKPRWRLPLCNGGLDHVVGVIHIKDFLTAYHAGGETSVLQLLSEKPTFVPQTVALDRLLTFMHDSHAWLVFLVDEYGGVTGIVTLADVVDELLSAQPANA